MATASSFVVKPRIIRSGASVAGSRSSAAERVIADTSVKSLVSSASTA
jgi:hypothetical protein